MSFQIHLKAKGCSGRGVRYRVLKPSQLDHNELNAAKELDKDDTVAEYNLKVQRLGLVQMVVEYTDPDTKELGGAKWTKADAGYLDAQWDNVFNTKDTTILKRVFQTEHGTSQAEVDDILSGKVVVLED